MRKYLVLFIALIFKANAQENVYCFNGNTNVSLPTSPAKLNNLSNYTFETWVFFDSGTTSPYQTIYSRDQGTNKTAFTVGYSLTPVGGTVAATTGVYYFRANSTAPVLSSSNSTLTQVYTNNWRHLAVTYDGTSVKFYINGNLTNSLTTSSASLAANTTTTNNARIGSLYSVERQLQGKLDNFRVWNYARTQSQIQQYYRCNMIGNETGLLLNYRFNQSSGTTVNDDVVPQLNGLISVGASNALCSGWAANTSTLNLTPSVTINPLTINGMCAGIPVTLNGSGASTYSWSTGATTNTIVVTQTTATTYSLIGTNSTNACYNQAIRAFTIHPNPNVTLTTQIGPVCFGSLTWITANSPSTTYSATTYTLYPGGNSSIGPTGGWNITPTITTTYTVNATSNQGCITSKTINIGVVACTGLNEINQSININVYPNPSTGFVKFENENSSDFYLTIYDVLGKVAHSSLIKGKQEIDFSNFQKGQYFYFIKTIDNKYSKGNLIIE